MTDTELKELMTTHIQYMQKSDEELRELVKTNIASINTNTASIGKLAEIVSANKRDIDTLKKVVYGLIIAVAGALARSFF